MPKREDIDSIKQKINLWGNEPAVLEEIGETIEDVQPPEPSIEEELKTGELDQEDLSLDDFLTQSGLDVEAEQENPEDVSVQPLSDESFSLDDLLDTPVPEEGGTEADDFSIPGDLNSFDDLDLNSLSGSDDEDPGLPDVEELPEADDLDDSSDTPLSDVEDFDGMDDLSMDTGTESDTDNEELEDLEGLSLDDELPGLDDLPGLPDNLDDLGDLGDLGDLVEVSDEDEDEDPGSDASVPSDEENLEELSELAPEEEGFDMVSPDEEFDLTSPDEDIPELGGFDEMSMDMEDEGESAQFSLDGFGDEFNFQEGISFEDDLDASLDSLDTLDDTFLMDDSEDLDLEEEDQFEISEEDLDALQESLRRLPLNLKVSIQDALALAEDLTSVRYRKLISMLIRGSSPRMINNEFFNITGKKIELPKGYQKLTGREFEVRKSGFFYQFFEKGWPFIRMVAVLLVLLGMTVFLSFQYVYRPLQAYIYYAQGKESIENDDYKNADSLFNKAYFGWSLGRLNIKGWPLKSKFLQYADTFRGRRAYSEAARMYEGLLGEYPDYVEGYHQYGLFLANIMGDYAKSAEVLSKGLNLDLYNYDLMVSLGDTYMLWADEDPDKLEDARFQYATALSRNDGDDEIILRMLRYFLKINDNSNISILSNIYSKKSKIKGDPRFIATTLSELGGYYIDRNQVSDAKDFLFKAEHIDVAVPDLHYQMARYFRRTYNPDQEKRALQKALYYLDQTQPLNRSQIYIKIAVYRRRGEISYDESDYDNAGVEFEAGIRVLEDSQVRGLIGTNSDMGELYADMGNLHYEIYNDLKGALNYYNLAEKNMFTTGDISYRKGYVYYDSHQYNQAVLEFESALKNLDNTRNTRFALANTLVKRQNLFGARTEYMNILRDLKKEESSLPFLAPQDIIEHRSLVNNFIHVYNNLAYVDYSLAIRGSDEAKRSQALLYLTKAADYADRITRDPETMVRSRPEDSLIFQNTMAIVKPTPDTDVFMYDEIPRTPEELITH